MIKWFRAPLRGARNIFQKRKIKVPAMVARHAVTASPAKVCYGFISYITRAVISLGSMRVHLGGILISLSEIFTRSLKLIG